MIVFLVSLFGALGVALRFGVNSWMSSVSHFWATVVVNLLGCFLAGVLFAYFRGQPTVLVPGAVKTALVIGFLGGLTTFSSFALDTMRLLERGAYGMALTNVVGQNLAGLLLCAAGLFIGKMLVSS
ncbi:MAG: CrcB family protein [Pseudobdellovibrionaceae bacterium]|nr:CrcB family protein [Bdellovibrionales bacterium]USN48913.1 MAG: CrcB family protein [Pseudobdellovibrionaceae bacterium]